MCARHILANWSQNWKGIKRRKKFWACARSTFEAQFKYNINALSKLETGIIEALIKYNKEKWCKAFFQTFSKCDSIDNNMAKSFNAWILEPRNKTIMMSRVSKSRAFAEIWTDGISPTAMMCNIEWNGDDGFEVLEGAYKHTVNLGQHKCNCRSWELKDIPCAHGIAAMNHLNMDASQAISSCKNPIVEPPEARKMFGRPPKNRIREIGEVRKAEKLPRMGTLMTCSICKGANHNKRNCTNLNLSLHQHPLKSPPSSSNTGTRRGAGSGYKKRPRVVGQGVFVVDTGYTCINQGLSSSKRVNTGVQSSVHVTSDIDFKPTKGLKWKGKQVMTQRELQVQSVMRRIQTRSKVVGIQTRAKAKGKSPSKKTS
ncbi:hypothetical protein H5410_045262 [Solanum commersonii]|uniref:SWIM-type domain-containing protein n=1 Tax=Solanum commersonii TaxID=4109 RepID=A0A9J5XC85_SOLCO|nr:hypothetical protein H5410_045262 [Solanum commersonii]